MSTFAEKKKKAQSAKPEFRDVVVSLDSGVSAERVSVNEDREAVLVELDALSSAAAERLSGVADTSALDKKLALLDKRLEKLENADQDSLVTVRLYKVPPVTWSGFTERFPARDGIELDGFFGCDMRAVCRAAAVGHGRILDGEEELEQSEEEWAELWGLIQIPEFNAVMDATFELNVTAPAARLTRLKNFSEAATASNKK